MTTIASFIIVLSGLLLYSDKAIASSGIEIVMPEKFYEKGINTDFFIWIVAQTISPLLIIIGSIMKPYFYAYIVPIYCYVLQFYFILIDYSLVDDSYSYAYSFGITALLLVIIQFARTASQRSTKMMIEEMKAKALKSKVEHAAD